MLDPRMLSHTFLRTAALVPEVLLGLEEPQRAAIVQRGAVDVCDIDTGLEVEPELHVELVDGPAEFV
eukprot:CAMPEP_0197553344 /NCGR_PEP_ID=MMETSP1320-20131121/8699_1 /TAXON_ID=91990 /ORGANISM="Bolidomonas sp., Strain RCC2347" /LENGTH=66 /DNA_ID=CAMNT_0043114085 /DNA_START=65 /DNA_END=261 /DNA_ORIENTATION=+